MSSRSHLSAVVFYYDTRVSPENQPEQIAHRCRAEMVLLCEQLYSISEQLTKALRQKNIEDIVRLSTIITKTCFSVCARCAKEHGMY